MARKKGAKSAVESSVEPTVELIAEAIVEEAPVEVVARRDRATSVGLDRARNGQFDYIDFAQPYGPERKIAVDGQSYEHCSEDLDGVWLYRHMQF